MIFESHAVPVNEPGAPRLDRAAVWDGLVRKANNALPFVPVISECTVVARHRDTCFDRDVVIRGDNYQARITYQERITLEEPHRVVFKRLSGPVLGTIANEIEGEGDELQLRFSFAMIIVGAPGGSEQKRTFAQTMTADYGCRDRHPGRHAQAATDATA
jgi:hypothetical protein